MGMDYSAIASKLKAMYGRGLTNADLDTLAQKGTVREICAYLKSTDAYREVLSGLDDTTAHRGEIEICLNRSIMQEYERLYSFMNQDKRTMLRFWFTRREINLLTAGLRHIFTHERIAEDVMKQAVTQFFASHSGIDIVALTKAKTLAEVADACRGTPYFELLKRAEEASSDYFSIAMMLDGYYYSSLWKAKDKYLDKNEIGYFQELIGTITDMLNIMWIYRGKKYFNFDSELIYTYLLPVRYRLTQEQITEMVSSPAPEKAVSATADTKYSRLFSHREQGHFIEEIYHQIVFETSKHMFRDYPKTMAGVFAYLYLKEYEISAVTMIIEGVRYHYDPSAIMKHIDTAGREA